MTKLKSPQAQQERTFHPFPRLPPELRWKIWAYNLPDPRIVSIRCGSDPTSPQETSSPSSSCSSSSSPLPGCSSPALIPANLHTCHESRREALRRYRLSFGITRGPGHIFFDPGADTLYFGPRDGFMASEAQLRTVLALCDPAELARVERVAINDALFWVYDDGRSSSSSNSNSSSVCRSGGGGISIGIGSGRAGMARSAMASSLLVDIMALLRARLPGLRELVFVPRDDNPLYSGDSCLVEPAIVQSRLARQVKEAMGIAFGAMPEEEEGGGCPWNWRVMTISADPDPPVYGRQVLGWGTGTEEKRDRENDGENASSVTRGYLHWRSSRGGSRRAGLAREENHARGAWVAGVGLSRLSSLEESVRRQFMSMEMDVCG
ncbi:hypothetical protein M406DRAFT_66519 [Cryphonectria parasitica EP155]|uniref:2EXR domain-containing protein n=1 Tax=Cryphonectria parasitica (strain ATCC 38755 / EP155) TaxID=660469 RepID=A0A9P5CSX8_CRYP1|nr:uncharacterized protein M406DRAFT_66519 [Cryphonectria parasitica EP155]KAF3770074.1 hypothetical protein M406DRAFT_66519 [Cryphonectria parasitica EP155]